MTRLLFAASIALAPLTAFAAADITITVNGTDMTVSGLATLTVTGATGGNANVSLASSGVLAVTGSTLPTGWTVVSNTMTIAASAARPGVFQSDVTTSAGGTFQTSGNQTYNGPVTVLASGSLSPGNGSPGAVFQAPLVTFNSTLTSTGIAPNTNRLVISGDCTFNGNVGGIPPAPLSSCSGAATLGAGTHAFSAITFDFQGPVTVLGDWTVSGGAPASASTMSDTVDGPGSLTLRSMSLLKGAGNTTPLSALSIGSTSSAPGTLSGTIVASGAISILNAVSFGTAALDGTPVTIDVGKVYAVDLTLSSAATLLGATGNTGLMTALYAQDAVTVTTPTLNTLSATFDGPVTLAADATFGRDLATTTTINGPLDGAYAFTIAGGLVTGADLGGTTPLTSLAVMGTSALGGNVTTTGTQTYGAETTITSPSLLAGSAVSFDASVEGPATLGVTAPVLIAGPVGATTALDAIVLGSDATISGGLVLTNGEQVYNGIVTLTRATTLGAIAGSGVIDQATFDLTLDTPIDSSFGGVLAGSGALSKQGGGTLTLTAVSSRQGGATLVDGGIVLAGPTGATGSVLGAGDLNVTGGATLAGAGVVLGALDLQDGVVSPGTAGAPVGEIVVASLSASIAASFAFDIAGTLTTSYDRIVTLGNAAIGGAGNFTFTAPFAPSDGDSFALISAGGATSGAFANHAVGDSFTLSGRSFSLSYASGAALLAGAAAVSGPTGPTGVDTGPTGPVAMMPPPTDSTGQSPTTPATPGNEISSPPPSPGRGCACHSQGSSEPLAFAAFLAAFYLRRRARRLASNER